MDDESLVMVVQQAAQLGIILQDSKGLVRTNSTQNSQRGPPDPIVAEEYIF